MHRPTSSFSSTPQVFFLPRTPSHLPLLLLLLLLRPRMALSDCQDFKIQKLTLLLLFLCLLFLPLFLLLIIYSFPSFVLVCLVCFIDFSVLFCSLLLHLLWLFLYSHFQIYVKLYVHKRIWHDRFCVECLRHTLNSTSSNIRMEALRQSVIIVMNS